MRVSLTEDSVHEIPVARALVDSVWHPLAPRSDGPADEPERALSFDPFSYRRRASARMQAVTAVGLGEVPRVVVRQATLDKIAHKLDRMGDFQPEIVYEQAASARSIRATPRPCARSTPRPATASSPCAMGSTCR